MNSGEIPDSELSKTLPLFGFRRRRADPALLFKDRVEFIEEEVRVVAPGVFVGGDGGWAEADLPEGAGAEQTSWTFVGRAPDRPEVWAIAEIAVAGPGHDLELVSSRDGGQTWHHYALSKVTRFARFESLHMTRDGAGAVTVLLDEDGAQSEVDSPEPGYYTYTTTDGGRTWEGPRRSATKPPEPDGALDGPDTTYDEMDPPGADRLREILRELAG